MGVFCSSVSNLKETKTCWSNYTGIPLDLNNPWKNEGFSPQCMGCVTPNVGSHDIYIYISFLQNDIHLHIVHLSESKTHHTKNINHLHEAHFANTFWDVRWDDVTMLFFPKPLLHSVENLSNVPSPYSTPTITRTDPWNCSLETVYSCMGSLEIYQFSSRSPDEWMSVQAGIGSLFGWENDINRFQSQSNFQRPYVAGVYTQNEDFQKQILRKFGESKVTLVNLHFNKNPPPCGLTTK